MLLLFLPAAFYNIELLGTKCLPKLSPVHTQRYVVKICRSEEVSPISLSVNSRLHRYIVVEVGLAGWCNSSPIAVSRCDKLRRVTMDQ